MPEEKMNTLRSSSVRENYLVAKQDWDERFGSFITRARNWRIAFLLICAIALIEGVALITVVRRSQVVPFVVAVNDLHQVIGMGIASQTTTNNPLLIKAALQRYIVDVRSISSDPIVLKERLSSVFDHTALASPAYNFLQEQWKSNSPFLAAENGTVQVQVQNITQLSPKSYEIDWTETHRDKMGNLVSTEQWKGVLGVLLSPPKDVSAAIQNPLGVYINSITWSENI